MARGNKGGGYSNPMQDHHKKARQKELQKNKERRTKERDEKARDMKRHHGQQQQKSAAEHKLARLQKELKLIQEAAAAARVKADADREALRIANQYKQPQRPLTELDDPRKSVYYDEIMNPYGAPPPGKPRLYHRRFGGVTMNIHEAIVPGEEQQVPTPPPPPPPPPQNFRGAQHQGPPSSYQQHIRGGYGHHQRQSHPNRQSEPQREEGLSTDRYSHKRQSLRNPLSTQSPGEKLYDNKNSKDIKRQEGSAALSSSSSAKSSAVGEMTKEDGTSSTPSSSAVQRTLRVAKRKGRAGALADIWASTEEVEYERHTNLVDLEADDIGTASKVKKKHNKKKKKKQKPPLEFYYRDNSGAVQGPFSKEQMRDWIDAGYFPLTTKARTNRMDPDGWVPMGDLPSLKATIAQNDHSATAAAAAAAAAGSADSANDSVQDRIAALKGSANGGDIDQLDSSMQAKIAAMRADLLASSVEPVGNDEADDLPNGSVQDRIAALRATANHDDGDGTSSDPSIQARIAAMKADLAGSVSSKPKDELTNDDDIIANDSIQDRIAALRNNAPPPPPPPPPAYPVNDSEHENHSGPSAYPLDDDAYAGVASYPVDDDVSPGVSSYPVDIDNYDSVAASYPVNMYEDDEYGMVENPVGNDGEEGVPTYPVNENDDDENAVAPYPTDYPGAADLAYPVTDAYPVDDHNDGYDPSSHDSSQNLVALAKKVVKVDKALVSFVPTNLQNKKRKVEKELDGNTKEGSDPNKKVKSTGHDKDDDYETFMGEIDGL
eukprot:jgi/Psemu1/20586/gm1.20586_g